MHAKESMKTGKAYRNWSDVRPENVPESRYVNEFSATVLRSAEME